MARIAGIKQHRTTTGKLKSVTIDVKKWGEYIQDLLDLIEIESIKKTAEYVKWDDVKYKYLKEKK